MQSLKLRAFITFLLKDKSGASMVEFVLCLPVFLLFMFGIIAVSSAFYIQNNMESAAREAARRIAVVEAPYTGGDVACTAAIVGSAEHIACTRLPSWADFTINASEEVCTPGQHVAVTVQVSVGGEQAALADIYDFFTGRTLSAEVMMRKEGECA